MTGFPEILLDARRIHATSEREPRRAWESAQSETTVKRQRRDGEHIEPVEMIETLLAATRVARLRRANTRHSSNNKLLNKGRAESLHTPDVRGRSTATERWDDRSSSHYV